MRQNGAIRPRRALLAIWLLAIAGLAASGCSGAGPESPTGLNLSRSRPAPIPLHVHLIARRVERLRGLRFQRIPKVRVVGSPQLARIGRRLRGRVANGLAAHPERSLRRRRLTRSEVGLGRLAGLLPQPQGTEASGATASAEQIGAAYDYADREVLLVNRAATSRKQLHLVIAHELTHALEDQHFRLRLATARGPSEAEQARRALIEGTATYLAARYDAHYQGNPVPLPLEISGQQSVFAAGGETPVAVKANTIFDYVSGPLFAASLYRRAGGSWRLIDRALRDPPRLTRYLLHPAAWPSARPVADVELRSIRPAGSAWRAVGGGLAGEELLRTILGEGAPTSLAQESAAGWRGGRFALWRRGADCPLGCTSDDAGVVAIRFHDHTDVRQLAEAFIDYALLGRLGQHAGARTWRVDDGYATLATDPRSAAIGLAPTVDLARELARRGARAAGSARRSRW